MSHNRYVKRSFPRSISALLVVVYSAGAGVVPRGRHRQKKVIFPTIEMHVDAICVFEWTRRYASR